MRSENFVAALAPTRLPALPELPLVSVIVANYNYERFLPQALESVLGQSYANFELIVVDDGSADRSRDVIARYASRDSRVVPLFKENGGQASAWNLALLACHGEIVCFLDSDDLFAPEKLRLVVEAFQAHPSAGIVCHSLLPIDSEGHARGAPVPGQIDSGWRAEQALTTAGWGTWPPTSGISLRRPVVDQLFPIPPDPRFRRGGADNYLLNAGQFLTEAVALHTSLGFYRIHAGNYIGYDRPSAEALNKGADDALAIYRSVQEFVRREYGPEVGARLLLEDLRHYWECLLGLYVILGKPHTGVHGFSEQTLISHVSGSKRKWIWAALVALPTQPATRLLSLWWSVAPWKHLSRPIARRLGLR